MRFEVRLELRLRKGEEPDEWSERVRRALRFSPDVSAFVLAPQPDTSQPVNTWRARWTQLSAGEAFGKVAGVSDLIEDRSSIVAILAHSDLDPWARSITDANEARNRWENAE